MVPEADDRGPADAVDPLHHHLNYIFKGSTELVNEYCTYFFPVGRPNGFKSVLFSYEKNNSIGHPS
jgi:hypothetical protein